MKPKALRALLCAAATAPLIAFSGSVEADIPAKATDEIVVQNELLVETNTGPSTVVVGGPEMSPDKTIFEHASKSADHKALAMALNAAGLALSECARPRMRLLTSCPRKGLAPS